MSWRKTAFWQRLFETIGNGYKAFVGGVVMLVGAVFAIAGKDKTVPGRLIRLAASVAGAIFVIRWADKDYGFVKAEGACGK